MGETYRHRHTAGLDADKAGMVARQLEIQLMAGNYEACHQLISRHEKPPEETDTDNPMDVPLSEIGLDRRTLNILDVAGYVYVRDLVGVDASDLVVLPGFGAGRYCQLVDTLRQAVGSNGNPAANLRSK